ncbi:hypothetical protein VSX61_09905 [Brenneria populi subsp. brevivirga]|uniref:hypothetical protein n=1 Tax=Brenneria populi TaxID=1505588 RepID=UPI002E188B40|nr:hypothetical protein [Brenneria populi subsp. brevivirga]
MMATDISAEQQMRCQHHIALYLAHRWFAFFEAPGGNLDTHMEIFHPQVRLSGHRGGHLFARDKASLRTWFASVPDEISSHHIVHSNYASADNGDGMLSIVVAYQSLTDSKMHGSIISYETRIEFTPDGGRFISLDKTPILANTRADYETSWAVNRALALVHAELAGITGSDGQLRTALGKDARQVTVHATAPEASQIYEARVTCNSGDPAASRAVHLTLSDDGKASLPVIERIDLFTPKS